MKKVLLSLLLVGGIAFASMAQSAQVSTEKQTTQTTSTVDAKSTGGHASHDKACETGSKKAGCCKPAASTTSAAPAGKSCCKGKSSAKACGDLEKGAPVQGSAAPAEKSTETTSK